MENITQELTPMSFGLNFRAMLILRCTFVATIIALIAGTASAQCLKKMAELPAAPELLGFKLGMTKEQIKAHVPQTEFGRTDDFGVSKTTINPYFDPKIDKTKFEGVRSISLDLLDQKLTSLWIGYDENFKAKTTDEFVKLLSQSLQLRASDWSSYRSRGQQMRCDDFQLIVTMVAGGPTLRVLDVAAEETVAMRRQAKEEQDSAAEAAAGDTAGAAEPTPEPEIIADKKSKTYYPGACRPEKEIAAANKVIFKTTDEAEKAGFKLAKNCH
jgi:hypothetical protein